MKAYTITATVTVTGLLFVLGIAEANGPSTFQTAIQHDFPGGAAPAAGATTGSGTYREHLEEAAQARLPVLHKRDDQEFDCTTQELRQMWRDYARLSSDAKQWMRLNAYHEKRYDFDGDGLEDRLKIVMTHSTRYCTIGSLWGSKEIRVKISFGGKDDFYLKTFTAGVLKGFKIQDDKQSIILKGVRANGKIWGKTLKYGNFVNRVLAQQ